MLTITRENPTGKVTFTLYGEVSQERAERETKECERRLEGLTPDPPKPERIHIFSARELAYMKDEDPMDIFNRA